MSIEVSNGTKGRSVTEYDLVVIGSGPAGQKAAIAAATLNKKVAVGERNFKLGRSCLHQGTIPSKTLREAVSYLSGVGQRDLYGSAHRVKEQITIEDLSFRTQRVVEREVNTIRDQLIRNYVDVIAGSGCFVDDHKLLVTNPEGNRILRADKFIVAVGSRPVRPEGVEFDDRRIVDSDGLLSLDRVPRSIIFVGAGIVGCEYATIFRTMGVRVTLVDGRHRPLEFVDDEIEDALYYHMRDEGIGLRFGETVSSVKMTDDDKVLVTTESGKHLSSEALMFAAGREGCSKSLNLEAVGIETDARDRISVNSHYQTSVDNIYAVGDVIGFPSLASTSMEQRRLAAEHAFGGGNGVLSSQLPYGVYTIPEIAMIGPSEEDLTRDSVPYESGTARFRELARAHINGGQNGILKIMFGSDSRKLLAVHILGHGATELIHIGQAVIDHGGTVDYLRDAVFNYPTLAEAYKIAALDGLNKL